MADKFCINCVHCLPQVIGGTEFHKCGRRVGTSQVNGSAKLHRWTYCSVQRDDGGLWPYLFNTCGKRGRFFQPK